jgi:alkanesulfonate monooxygenase SsuD/methylene tetrahydromethanopterin reductase-like flavin-dependent oxidoreductase (luciferase family)
MRDPGASRRSEDRAAELSLFRRHGGALHKVEPEDLTENSVLIGSPQRITDTLKKVEAAGFHEVILYFNVGLKPHQQVKDEMERFMREVAPAFDGAHKQRAA